MQLSTSRQTHAPGVDGYGLLWRRLAVAGFAVVALVGCATESESRPTLQIGTPTGGEDSGLAGSETVDSADAGNPGGEDATTAGGDSALQADGSAGEDASVPPDTAAATDAVPGVDDAAPVDSAASGDGVGPKDSGTAADVAVAVDATLPPDVPASSDVGSPSDVAVPVDAVVAVDSGPAVDTGPPALVCGNGLCQGPAETPLTCPSDCATGWQACANGACQAAAMACSKAVACTAATACAANCKDLGCVSACTSGLDWAVMSALLVPLASCAHLHGCLAAAPAGPSAGPSTCKNGVCDGGETHLTCPADCPFPISASELCQTQKCGQSYGACAASAGCVDAAVCWNKSFDQKCLPDNQAGQTLSALIKCIQSSCTGVLPSQSCAGKCGQYTKDAPCQCDSKCKQYNDCCPDISLVCGG